MKPKLRIVVDQPKDGPSLSYLMLTRNPYLEPPKRFEPTRKNVDDVVI